MATDNASIYPPIITGAAALLGVLIGGLLQYLSSARELTRRRTQALNVVTLSIAEMLAVFDNFNNEKNIHKIHTLGIRMPKFLREQLSILHTAISDFDPQIAIDLLWIKEASSNVDSYLEETKLIAKTNQLDNKITPILGMALVDVKNAIHYSKRILIRGYNASDRTTRAELFKKDSLRKFFQEKCTGRNRFANQLIKYGLKRI